MTPSFARNRASAAPPPAIVPTCDWDRPGNDPFMGDVVAAVDRYHDIPLDVRERLKARMVKRSYDDVVTIRRDSIQGNARYATTIRDMHFGSSRVCRTVTRSAWRPQMQERGLVYCEGSDCILVPTVCRNVSRIARAEVADERAEGEGPPLDVVPMVPDGVVAVELQTGLPSGLPGLDSQPAWVSPSGAGGGGGGGFALGPVGGASGFVATASMSTATLVESPEVGVQHAMADTQSSIAVTAIPEPETWCLMLAGMGALGAVSRRRRRARLS